MLKNGNEMLKNVKIFSRKSEEWRLKKKAGGKKAESYENQYLPDWHAWLTMNWQIVYEGENWRIGWWMMDDGWIHDDA